MLCPSCDFDNPDGLNFCGNCGDPLARVCAACGARNQAGFNFCGECGVALAAPAEPVRDARAPRDYTPRHLAEKILREKAALEGERKHVTVMFADLADSTAFASAIDPEEMHALMDRAFKRILGEVHRYEGTVNQFTGDGVMALFGAPIALEDSPRCAIRAALGIQRAIESLDAEVAARHGRDFRMRIGIHTGPVVVGKIGDDLRMDYTAVGDTTNLAARLEQIAAPGSVVVSAATRRLVEGFFDFRTLEPAHVKGLPDPVQAFEVVGERGVSGRIEAESEAQLTPYSGRETELDALMSAMRSARAGRGQVVFVVGDAGIGKSRLLHEFRRKLSDVPHAWFEGRCASFARSTPFYAVADALRRQIGVDDRDDERAAGAKVEALGRETDRGLGWTLPFIRTLLSLPSGNADVDALDPMTRRSESGRALRAHIMGGADERLLVVVIEDLHWIDVASQEFLAFLADSIPGAKVLLVMTHRPGYEQPFGDRSYQVRVPLQPLPTSATSAMVASILASGPVPDGLRELIESKAEGNPLFIEEVARSLVEEGVVRSENGKLTLSRDLAAITVPDRVQDVLMARLDRLQEGPKRAIQIASVIGREFAMRLLQRISDAGEGINPIVRELRALELIYEKASHPELAYMFKHALTHDVAYQSVLLARRRTLHGIVGTAIEELYADRLPEHYEALAHHFGEAEQWARALGYHELASEKAAAAYANHTAAEHCRAGLEVADRLGSAVSSERQRVLLERLGDACWSLSDFFASGEAFERAARLVEDPAKRSLALGRSAFSFLWSHDYPRSRRIEEEGSELARGAGADGARAFCMMVHDEHELVHGRALDDDSRARTVIALAERTGDPILLVTCLSHTGQRAEWRGEFRKAIALTERAVAIAAQVRRPSEALFGQWFLGIASVALGDYARGIGVCRTGLELCDRIGDRALTARLLNTTGWAYAEFGCHTRAAEYNRKGTEVARQLVELGLVAGAPELYANASINLAGNLTALGDLDAAEAQLAPIQRDLAESDDPWMRWRYTLHLHDQLARIALARGDAEEAARLGELELAGARTTQSFKLQARALELCGRAQLVQDDRERAERSLAEAVEVARRIEHPPVVWRAESLLAELAARRGESAEAERRRAAVRALVAHTAGAIPEPELRREFLGLGERLLTDPINSYR